MAGVGWRASGTLRNALLAWPPPLVAAGAALAAALLHQALWGAGAPWGKAPLTGTAVAAAGGAWALWAWTTQRASGNPLAPAARPLVLVDHGPYRFGRHPQDLGTAAALSGAALAFGVPLMALAAAAFVAMVASVHQPHEEAQLAARFGGWWRDYAAQVRRWF